MEYHITTKTGHTIKRRAEESKELAVLLEMLPLNGEEDINALVDGLIAERSLKGEWRKRMVMMAWGAVTALHNLPFSQESIERLGQDFATGWAFQILLWDKVIACHKD